VDGIPFAEGFPMVTLQQKNVMKLELKSVAIVLLALLVVVATGCRNTAHGIGKDMQDAGEKIQEKTK